MRNNLFCRAVLTHQSGSTKPLATKQAPPAWQQIYAVGSRFRNNAAIRFHQRSIIEPRGESWPRGLHSFLVFADAGVFRELAFAASVHFQLETDVLRFGFRRLLELDNDIVTVAFR